ncbi:MAG: septal ring lytic transglycosylase RlpA family protein [Tolypothrix sp. T3-bin4]|nr:septal ring lytic transglycosylase RlpA family protein [Tolypothrix sp. T3-bin4]
MSFFGLVRVTSWVSCFLASSQGLFRVPNYFDNALPTEVLSVVSTPIELATPRLFSSPLYPGIWSSKLAVAAVPNIGFQFGLGTSEYQFQPEEAAVHPPSRVNGLDNRLCRPQSNSSAGNFQPVATHQLSSSTSWSEVSYREPSKTTLPQQILQVMQNLFPWFQRTESAQKALISSIVVVSTQASEQLGNQENREGRTIRRGFWHYSQQSKKQAGAAVSQNETKQFQVWVKGQLIAQLPKQQQANLIAQRLKRFLSDPSLDTSLIEPTRFDGSPAIKIGDRILFKISKHVARDLDRNGELLAIEWANNLRGVLGKAPLKLAEAQRQLHNLVETSKTFEGQASWYGSYFHGRLTATGETYNQHELTAAHPSLPFNTYLKVRNLENDESVIVRINDRGPYVADRTLDLSREAARCINGEKAGIIPIEAVIMEQPSTSSEQFLVNNFLVRK